MRIEDIDSPRVKRGAAEQAIEDLHWLGLDWDEGPDVGGPHGPYVQTQRLPLYQQALAELKARERIYPCKCTRSDVEAAASAPHAGQEGPVYPGTCTGRSVSDAADLAGATFAWRFRATDTTLHLQDLVSDHHWQNVGANLGDFVVAKSEGLPAYQLAVVLDDHAMQVTEVLRGDDLLPSAFRQLELYEFFKWRPPAFAHVPLVVGPDGRRLAKRHGDTRLATLRSGGVPPEKLVGLLAWSSGLLDRPQSVRAAELIQEFDVARIRKEQWAFTDEHMRWLMEP